MVTLFGSRTVGISVSTLIGITEVAGPIAILLVKRSHPENVHNTEGSREMQKKCPYDIIRASGQSELHALSFLVMIHIVPSV